eukprot:augustus_masked-scaffold_12-processed-gene-6.49-mRNA-1 protein AED:0.45 eAED:0.45 QI:0/-1/0/1/-1/1/1/0/518
MKYKLEFKDTEFSTRYQRNNKKKGLKNLRCFPSCGFRHKERGFCGSSVLIQASFSEQIKSSRYLCVAEFGSFVAEGKKKTTLKTWSNTALVVECLISRKNIEEQTRDAKDPTKPLMQGVLLNEESNTLHFEVNKARRGWHYGWQSNKHTCDTKHSFVVYLLEETSRDMFRVVSVLESSKFLLFCRRRRRFVSENQAPASKLTLSKFELRASLEPEIKKHCPDIEGSRFQRFIRKLTTLRPAENKLTGSESIKHEMLVDIKHYFIQAGFKFEGELDRSALSLARSHLDAYRRKKNCSLQELLLLLTDRDLVLKQESFPSDVYSSFEDLIPGIFEPTNIEPHFDYDLLSGIWSKQSQVSGPSFGPFGNLVKNLFDAGPNLIIVSSEDFITLNDTELETTGFGQEKPLPLWSGFFSYLTESFTYKLSSSRNEHLCITFCLGDLTMEAELCKMEEKLSLSLRLSSEKGVEVKHNVLYAPVVVEKIEVSPIEEIGDSSILRDELFEGLLDFTELGSSLSFGLP